MIPNLSYRLSHGKFLVPLAKRNLSQILYKDHRPTNAFQKSLLAVGSSFAAWINPYRGDMVAAFGEVSGYRALKNIHYEMLKDETGRQILRDKPRINSATIPLEELKNYPEDTLGYHYMTFMTKNNFKSDDREPVHYIDDVQLAYVMQRYREIHDFNHVLSGISKVNLLSEAAVKAFEAVQTGLPMCSLGAIMTTLSLKSEHREIYLKYYVPWALYCGSRAKLSMNIYFEKELKTPMRELLHKIDMTQAPNVNFRKNVNINTNK